MVKKSYSAPNLVAFVLLMFCLSTGKISRGQSHADIIQEAEKAVVRIEVETAGGAGQGSGFLVTREGIVITNCHVISGAIKAKAIFNDSKTVNIVGTKIIDQARDIAIAVLDPGTYPTIPLAKLNPRKGERVTALGSPLGLSFTATQGIVSAIRSSEEMKREMGLEQVEGVWVQVDAALSPGNSGGPLINDQGEVVAMSTLASQGVAQNVNFGICVVDFAAALGANQGNPTVSLMNGAAKLEKPGRSRSGGGREGPEGKISDQAIEAYVAASKDDKAAVTKTITQSINKVKSLLKDIKSAEVKVNPNVAYNRRTGMGSIEFKNAKKRRVYYFLSLDSKQREITRLDNQIRNLQSRLEDASSNDPVKSLMAILKYGGATLNTREESSIGLLKDATAVSIYEDKFVVIDLESSPYILLTQSTTGIYPGQPLEWMPVFVGGVVPIEATANSPSMNLTLLVQVPDERLKKFATSSSGSKDSDSKDGLPDLEGLSGSDSAELRDWSDQSGKFKIRAVLLSKSPSEVTLKKEDGKVITVPRSKLCKADQQFLSAKE